MSFHLDDFINSHCITSPEHDHQTQRRWMVSKEEKPLLAITKLISTTLEKASVEKHSSV